MADFDGIISSSPDWVDIPSLSTSAIALGGTAGAGVMNAQAVALTKRTNYLINYSVQISPATGNAGIGVANPIGRLQIGDSSANINNKIVFGKAQASTAANLPAIGQRSAGVANDLAIAATSSTGSVKIFTGNSTNSGEIGTGSNTERVIVNSFGEVGVGTSTPFLSSSSRGNVSINGSAGSIMNLGVGDVSKAYLYTDGTTFDVWNVANGAMRFGTNNLIRATFGVDGIFNKYVSSSTGTETVGIRFTNGTQSLGSIRSYNVTGYNQHLRFYTSNAGTETHAMTLDSSGNVGIGTTAPTSNGRTLVVSNTGTGPSTTYLQNSTTGSSNADGVMLALSDNNGILWNYEAGKLLFGTNNAERMQIDAAGNVGIGGTPTQKFDVIGTADTAGQIRTTGTTNSAFLSVSSGNGTTSSQYSYVRYLNNQASPQEWRIGTYGDNTFVVRDHTVGTTRFKVDTSGWTGFYMGGSTVYVGSGLLTNGTTNDSAIRWDATGALKISKGTTNVAQFNSTGDLELKTTGSLKIPNGTTAQRPASPAEGMIRKNDTTGRLEGYLRGAWRTITEDERSIAPTNLFDNAGFDVENRPRNYSASGANNSFLITDRWKWVSEQSSASTSLSFGISDTFLSQTFNGSVLTILNNTGITIPSIAQNYFEQTVMLYPIGVIKDKVTLSFKVSSPTPGTYPICIIHNGYRFLSSFTISAVDVLEKKSITMPVHPLSSGSDTAFYRVIFPMGFGSSFKAPATGSWENTTIRAATSGALDMMTVANNSLNFAEMQLEVGDNATSFIRKDPAMDLFSCMQHYQASVRPMSTFAGVVDGATLASPAATTNYASFGTVQLSPMLFITPVITAYNPNSGSAGTARNITAGTDVAVQILAQSEKAFSLRVNNVSVTANSEVYVHWSADTGY